MGFLDKNVDVVDMVLTGIGQKLLSQGKLRFVYWMAFDDEVDYDPYVASSGSMTAVEVTASKVTQIENGLVREAVTGYRDFNPFHLDRTNVNRPLFSIPQGQTIIPKVVKVHRTGTLSLNLKIQKVVDKYSKKDKDGTKIVEESVDRGFNHFDSSRQSFEYRYTPNSFPTEHQLEGFKVRVFSSGSGGLVELNPKHDLNDDVSFKSDLKLETVQKVLKRGGKI
jgi:hypothetical protein